MGIYANYMIAFILCAAALVLAALGTDFSPSFTAMFTLAFLCLTALGEICARFRRRGLGRLFCILGALFVYPAVLIYAAQDDWFFPLMRFAPIAGLILHLAVWLLYRRNKKKIGFGGGIENWILLSDIAFTIPSAIPCPALWPYGLGLIAILIARRLEDWDGNARLPVAAGMLLCAVFLAAPMVF